MKTPRNVIQGLSGGILGGATVGLIEACYLLGSTGAPDYLSPFYATALYGLIGAPLGIGAGLALSVVEKLRGKDVEDAFAWSWGYVGGMVPQVLFVSMYIVRKVVYAEQGLPLPGLLGILANALFDVVVVLLLGPKLVDGPFKFLLKAPGLAVAWGGLLAVTGAVAMAPLTEDPRANFAADKPVPPGLEEAPDVLLIMIDTLRADYLGIYGKEGNPSPNLDALAADGIVFEQAFAQASWTRSSGATLFTSRIPSSHNADTKAAQLSPDAVTWAEPLQADGLTTGALVNNINMTSTFGFDQGFDTFLYESPAYHFGATESVFGLTMYKVVHKLSERVLKTKHVESFYQPAEVVFADVKTFLEANADGRVALYAHLMEPHDPYFEHPSLAGEGAEYNGVAYGRAEHEHPDPSDAEYLKQVYLDEIRFMDAEIGRFVAWLEESGRYDNTLIIITADHGEEFGEHGGFWHGTTLYEEQIHIPLIIKLPKAEAELAGTRVPWQVRSLDVAPTIAAYVGTEPDEGWQGRDLLADVRGWVAEEEARLAAEPEQAVEDGEGLEDEVGTPEEPAVPVEEPVDEALEAIDEAAPVRGHARDRVVVAEEDFEGNVIRAIRRFGTKYIEAEAGGPRGLPEKQLFDVQEDPKETEDLLAEGATLTDKPAAEHAEALSELLRTTISEAESGALSAETVQRSAAECERLKALGYLGADEEC
ncbi:MAG: hypothetical protein EP330_20725 [Deltaproteobacteria bacterium]|nr:MAG: hypothetical protein EP330_20725 [Deltaproteobacteria bacterium]